MFDLQPIVQRVTKPMRPMKKRQGAKDEQIDPHQGMFEAGAAVREALFGNLAAARQSAIAALGHSKGRGVEYGAAIALALSGDLSRAEALTNDLEKRFPEDTSVQFSYRPTLRAFVALEQGNPSNAIKLLQTAVPDELGAPQSS